MGGLNMRNLLSHSLGDYKSKIKVLAATVSSESSLPGFYTVTFSQALHCISVYLNDEGKKQLSKGGLHTFHSPTYFCALLGKPVV